MMDINTLTIVLAVVLLVLGIMLGCLITVFSIFTTVVNDIRKFFNGLRKTKTPS